MEELRIPGQTWDESSELFEHQGQALTVGRLRQALAGVDDGVRVVVVLYEGGSRGPMLDPVEVGLLGGLGPPDCVAITASALG